MYYGVKNPHGGDIYEEGVVLDFSANVNPYGAPDSVLEAAKKGVDLSSDYPDPFCRELTAAIARHEQVPAETVFVGCGASELIYTYCRASRFKTAVVAVPTFSEYASALKETGTEIIRYYMKKDNGFLPGEDLIALLEEKRPDALFLCNPNNPTGRTVPAGLLKKILSAASEYGIRFFLDECFYELSDQCVTLKEELSSCPGLFLLRAFTKSFALAGLRIGYALCADTLLLKKMSMAAFPWSVSTPAQMAAAAALKEDDYLTFCKREIIRERNRLTESLAKTGFTVYPSDVNFLFFEARADLAALLKKEGIAIRSCDNYDGLGPGYFRIAVKTPEENDRLIAAVRRNVQKQK